MAYRLPDPAPLFSWYAREARDLPWRRTKDPYRIWISEIMLQQTRVEAVLPRYENFLDRLPDIESLAAVAEKELLKLWEGLGYYSRARNLSRAAREIVTRHGGVFPRDYAAVRALPGVGDYTAGAIVSFAFDLPYPAVDGNVLRVAARLLDFGGDILLPQNKKILTAAVAAAQPPDRAGLFNQAVMELGATVCLPNAAPRCAACPFAATCAGKAAGREALLPTRHRPAPRKKEEKTVFIFRVGDEIALQKRPDTGLLSGLFEPFSLPGKLTEREAAAFLADKNVAPLHLTPLGEAKHLFTHIEWRLCGFEVLLSEEARAAVLSLSPALFFATRETIDRDFAVPSAYRAYRPYM